MLPKGVVVTLDKDELKVKGPKGELQLFLQKGLDIKIEGEKAFVRVDGKAPVASAIHGLYRSLLNNMVIGVSKGFEKRLSMVGVGFRAAIQGDKLDLQIGTSHPIKVAIPKAVKVEVEKSTLIKISGIDKQVVGQFAAAVRAYKVPEPYKGKGIRYEDEYVRKKAGKAAKGKTA
uniref:50S ribosomal protein L6 n=1 Tax=uncultured Chlamydiae bacterium Rifle_16ft_4_minimus_1822 TaxID=1665093 RepID=A0A0H4T1D4_9BACT|nr:50S ribosomal protein L6, large subunit ribosomal protein L6 [uncultured Chlamydiae bacterium Rifle_16ft_4_minimus_1822]